MLCIHYLYSICLLLGFLSNLVMVFGIHKTIHATIQCLYSKLHLMIELPQSLKSYLPVFKVAVILKGSRVSCQVGLWLTFRNLHLQSVLLVKAHSPGTLKAVRGLLNTCFRSEITAVCEAVSIQVQLILSDGHFKTLVALHPWKTYLHLRGSNNRHCWRACVRFMVAFAPCVFPLSACRCDKL